MGIYIYILYLCILSRDSHNVVDSFKYFCRQSVHGKQFNNVALWRLPVYGLTLRLSVFFVGCSRTSRPVIYLLCMNAVVLSCQKHAVILVV